MRQLGKKFRKNGRPQMRVWRKNIACWINKVTNTHSEYVILLYSFFWVIPRRLNFIRRNFGTLYSIHVTESSEKSGHKIQTPGNPPNEWIQHSEYGDTLESISHYNNGYKPHLNVALHLRCQSCYLSVTKRVKITSIDKQVFQSCSGCKSHFAHLIGSRSRHRLSRKALCILN